jgi:hypothetical protein
MSVSRPTIHSIKEENELANSMQEDEEQRLVLSLERGESLSAQENRESAAVTSQPPSVTLPLPAKRVRASTDFGVIQPFVLGNCEHGLAWTLYLTLFITSRLKVIKRQAQPLSHLPSKPPKQMPQMPHSRHTVEVNATHLRAAYAR